MGGMAQASLATVGLLTAAPIRHDRSSAVRTSARALVPAPVGLERVDGLPGSAG